MKMEHKESKPLDHHIRLNINREEWEELRENCAEEGNNASAFLREMINQFNNYCRAKNRRVTIDQESKVA